MVLIDHQTLAGQVAEHPVCRLADGTPLSPATARRLACQAAILPVVLDGTSQPLDVGRAGRLPTPAQRKALLVRDGGCVFPGCDRPVEWCDVHHLQPWEQGGATDLANLVTICERHHHLVHEGGWQLTRGARRRRHSDRARRHETRGAGAPSDSSHEWRCGGTPIRPARAQRMKRRPPRPRVVREGSPAPEARQRRFDRVELVVATSDATSVNETIVAMA